MRSRRVIVTLKLDTFMPVRVLRSPDWRVRDPNSDAVFSPRIEQVSVNFVKPRQPKPGRKGPSHD